MIYEIIENVLKFLGEFSVYEELKMNDQLNRRDFLMKCSASAPAAVLFSAAALNTHAAQQRPNILWIIVEDMSAHFSCYGETTIQTPNVDRLASNGIQFKKAFVTCPVCSPSRSALMTGMYQTSIGAQHHRSGRGVEKIHLPNQIQLIPKIFQQAGYYTVNQSYANKKMGKTDYNFEWDSSVYDGPDWSGRQEGQPFFAQIQLNGGKMRHSPKFRQNAAKILDKLVTPEEVKLPPYYPDDPVIRQDWADYLNTVQVTDREVGQIMKRLQDEGIQDNTYVFFITDHGISHARGKQYLYEEGIHIPFIVQGPGLEPEVRNDLIEHIDMAATSLAFAGIAVPDYMQGRDLFADDHQPREYIVSARDRCDETVDRIRCVRTDRWKYIRNFYPERPHLQPNRYKDNKEIVIAIRRLYEEGKLDEVQSLVTVEARPHEELYDLSKDAWEIDNLAVDPQYEQELRRLREILKNWIIVTDDRSKQPESERMYDSDMKVYIDEMTKAENLKGVKEIEENIALMKKWKSERK